MAEAWKQFEQSVEALLSAANYITIADTSRATTTRDLHELVMIGALTQTGTLKSTRYHLNISG